MSSNFFAMVERMKLIDRWALMNNTGKENIDRALSHRSGDRPMRWR